jgi:hypothetical protein
VARCFRRRDGATIKHGRKVGGLSCSGFDALGIADSECGTRTEAVTWWPFLARAEAADYVKRRGIMASKVMTAECGIISETTSLEDIAKVLESAPAGPQGSRPRFGSPT